jgi:hypothetical protein
MPYNKAHDKGKEPEERTVDRGRIDHPGHGGIRQWIAYWEMREKNNVPGGKGPEGEVGESVTGPIEFESELPIRRIQRASVRSQYTPITQRTKSFQGIRDRREGIHDRALKE